MVPADPHAPFRRAAEQAQRTQRRLFQPEVFGEFRRRLRPVKRQHAPARPPKRALHARALGFLQRGKAFAGGADRVRAGKIDFDGRARAHHSSLLKNVLSKSEVVSVLCVFASAGKKISVPESKGCGVSASAAFSLSTRASASPSAAPG